MHWLALGTALLVAVAIIAIGTQYVVSPLTATRSFGLPLPENDTNIAWWLRLKGVRDIVSGLAVLAFMMWSAPSAVGIILLVEAIIPLGDMLVILAAKGSAKSAFDMHGLTAVVMVLAGLPLMILSGLGMSPTVAAGWPWIQALFGGSQSARSIHFLVLCGLILFLLVHLVMVILTGFGRQMRAMIWGSRHAA